MTAGVASPKAGDKTTKSVQGKRPAQNSDPDAFLERAVRTSYLAGLILIALASQVTTYTYNFTFYFAPVFLRFR